MDPEGLSRLTAEVGDLARLFRSRRELGTRMFFADIPGLLRVVVVSLCAYSGLILLLRIAGKRSLAKLNAFDLVVTVAFGSTLATVLLSKDVPLAEGLTAFAMLAGLQYLVSRTSLRSALVRRAVRSRPRLLVEDGEYLLKPMADERVTRSELDSAIRKKGIGRIDEVGAAILETDGSFSVIRRGETGDLTDGCADSSSLP